jgi:molybdate transport system permease protein
MTAEDWQVVRFTVWAALVSVILIVPPGLALAWLLARKNWPGKSLVETFVTLPLVIPPVATGLILLHLFGKRGPIGKLLAQMGIDVVFTWKAVVLALSIMSLPLLVRSARAAFETVNVRLENVARTLGANPLRVFFTISLPLAKRGILAGVILAFARALGEFGATIMIAGNIPGQTSTIALEIFHSVQLGHDTHAWRLLIVSALIAFAAVFTSEWLLRKKS